VDAKAEMWKLPAMYVGKYAEQDAVLTYKLWDRFKKEIEDQDLHNVFELETEVFPCLVDMKFKGVRVDTEQAHKLKSNLATEEKNLLLDIKKETNVNVELWAAASIAKVFDHLKLPYDRTEKSNAPSFTKNFLQNHSHPLIQKISKSKRDKQSTYNFY
jgi:DNA polymerase I - 3''-5'' exonuclease and polymerase domains